MPISSALSSPALRWAPTRPAGSRGVYSFALDTNQDAVYPGTALRLLLKDGSVVTPYNYAKEFIEGHLLHRLRLLNLSMGAMDITDMAEIEVALGDEFPADIKETVMELRQQIIDGELEVPYNPVVRGGRGEVTPYAGAAEAEILKAG